MSSNGVLLHERALLLQAKRHAHVAMWRVPQMFGTMGPHFEQELHNVWFISLQPLSVIWAGVTLGRHGGSLSTKVDRENFFRKGVLKSVPVVLKTFAAVFGNKCSG